MSKLKFSKEDIEKLKNNPYIFNITEKAITYADEFKEKFIELYNNGITPTEIFRKCEIPPEIIGQKRIDTFSYRVKQKLKMENCWKMIEKENQVDQKQSS